jgi:dTDP-glucose 4,6-dehydratase
VLVTGGAGFIGANFCHHWTAAHPADRVVVLDALTYAGNLHSIRALLDGGLVRFVRGDIGDRELLSQLLGEEQIDTVVNFAAESHVDRSIEDPQRFLHTNVLGTQVLLEAVRRFWTTPADVTRRFHHISTDEVYGSLAPDQPASTESSVYAPSSPYAASKAAADHLVQAYARTYGLPCTITNCSNNYGPYQFPEKLLPLCILNILEGRALPIYGDGLQVRDWLHVSDHCRAIDIVLSSSPVEETWNIGGGSAGTANLAVVGQLCDLVDAAFQSDTTLAARYPQSPPARGQRSRQLIAHVPDRPGHDRRYAVDCSKLRQRLGYSALTSLEAGLAATVRWYLANESWWRPTLSGEYRTWYAHEYPAARSRPTIAPPAQDEARRRG